jgi:DNA-binding GntR family transcriptional regulator
MPELGVPKFKAIAIRDTVAVALRRSLLEGKFRPGEDLSDAAIAAEFQISRGPVREAMLVLAGEGLLTHTHNRGFSVPTFTARDLEQIEVVRVPLETAALSAAREHVTAQYLKRLTETKKELVHFFEAAQLAGWIHGEIEFHTTIWEMSGNPWLETSLRRVVIPSFTYATSFQTSRPELTPESVERNHLVYIEFLSGCDNRTAEECVRIHVGRS